MTVTAAPSQHFSGRGLKDRNATLWSSLVIRSPRHSVFFSGDTGLTSEYATIRERLGPLRSGDAGGGRFPAGALGHVQPGAARVG
ncbi:MBL fold metallo-hydrolase [Rhodoferax sediminis]|uniref:MBL fold metallo-hydrolase n=1 Tax=Rhodoferax sediminis TaxID=2509614 RepID=UPI003B82DC50